MQGKQVKTKDFSHADIRGIDFSKSILTGVNFTYAKAGLRLDTILIIIGIICFIDFLSSFTSILAAFIASYWLSLKIISAYTIIPALTIVLIPLSLLIFIFWKGIGAGFVSLGVLGVFALAAILPLAAITPVASYWVYVLILTGAGALGSIGWTCLLSVSITVAWLVSEIFGIIFIAISWIGGAVLALFWATPKNGAVAVIKLVDSLDVKGSWTLAVLGAGVVLFLGSFVSWKALAEDSKFIFIRDLATYLSTIGGTNFSGADLTDADFSYATLRNTNFNNATLIRTRWFQAKKITIAYFKNSYLLHAKVRQLLITGQGQGGSFDGLMLRGVNLRGARLQDASFINSDLNEADLEYADLSRAKLVQTQLDRTNLSRSCLTGAYIENWGITAKTVLKDVQCGYVYTRLPTKDNPEPYRKPDNFHEEFQPGDFADFIKPLTDTLDLYHNQRVDPRAVAISLKFLAEKNPDAELSIAAMEVKGKDKFILRAKTAPGVDKSKLSAEYFHTYQEIKSLPEVTTKLLIAEKDERIRSLEKMIETALNQPKFRIEHNPGGIMSESINVNAGGSIGAVGGGDIDVQGVMNLGTINGTVTNTINHLQESSEPDAPKLADLLKQLQSAISQSDLGDKDKVKALKHLDAIAKQGCNKANSELRETTETALDALTGIFGKASNLLNSYLPLLDQIQQIIFPM